MSALPATASTVRWGIIGVGNVTEAKSGPGFSQASNSELVAVMRRDAAACADYASRHGVPQWTTDADALINTVDAVYIATPPDSHCDYTVRALAAGKPVYVEKPIARTAIEAQRMVDAAEAAGLPLYVAYYRRAMPRFVRVQELINSGALGRIHAVTVRNQRPAPADHTVWRIQPEISGGGLFVDLASHTLDLIDHLLGPVVAVSGMAENRHSLSLAEDLVSASFTLESGVVGSGLWCYAAGPYIDRVEIIGEDARLSFSSFGQEPLELRRDGQITEIDAPYPAVVQLPLIQTVVDELLGRGTCPSTGRSALRTAQVLDQVLADYRQRNGISLP